MKTKPHSDTRQRKKRTSGLLIASAMPTRERLAHAQGAFQVGGDARTGKILRMMDAPLEQLIADKRLSEIQYEALRKLRLHWYLGNLAGLPRAIDLNRIAANWDGTAQSERELLHRDAFVCGWDALRLLERPVVNSVVLLEVPLVDAGGQLGYRSPYRARTAALELLRSGADRLIGVWRL